MAQKKLSILAAVVLILTSTIFIMWFVSEKSRSYSEPQDPLVAFDKDILLIPAYKGNNEALYFFIKEHHNLGAAFVEEGLLGWKARMFSWSPMGTKYTDRLNGYKGHGDQLIYGLIQKDDDRIIKVNGEKAEILPLAALPEKEQKEYGLENMCLWYFKSDMPLKGGNIELVDNHTGEQIDRLEI
ncbi:aspartyl-tRNA synthetase [Bacillus lacus]|uniref:Aspartyl-tRNA synthetase n=1 Tax=Metabacillus lacus TaxID=1983721 RepID=A0A7X2IZ38_9BACI|nr:aspartyl-tRNA synthetase [Metabacillus lacus]MRX72437.1 aspartyl-tRNA synthetase [Metabacillus lacus]